MDPRIDEARRPARPADAAPAPNPPARPSRGLLARVGAFVLVVAIAGYARYGAWQGAPESAPQADPQAQIAAMVGKLEERLKTQPDDATGWSMLGRSYSVLGRYAEATAAFKRVIALQPNDAQAHADQADALAMANGRQLAGEPARLIARALELDPKNLKALALAGTIAFERGDYATAVRHWEGALAVAEPGSELVRNLQGGVNEARTRGGLAPAAGASAAAAPIADAASAADARIRGRVTLAPALLANAVPGDTVFVFARAVDGRRAPLAILRKQVKDLPFDFTLDDSLAMSPALRLSSATQVVVGARVSKSGNAVAQAGDLQGLSAPVPVGTSGVKIEIGEVLK
jgi:cytochrome c-type biogenesis protein CcmH